MNSQHLWSLPCPIQLEFTALGRLPAVSCTWLSCSLGKKHSAQHLALCRRFNLSKVTSKHQDSHPEKRPGRERDVDVFEFWYLRVIPAGGAPAVRHMLIPSHFEQVCVAGFSLKVCKYNYLSMKLFVRSICPPLKIHLMKTFSLRFFQDAFVD